MERNDASTRRQTIERWFTIVIMITLAGIVVSLMLPAGRSKRSVCKYNLKEIGLALHNYQEEYGSLPPAYIADEQGRPMHSWRVLILPWLDQESLYRRYRFDEPWNGPNNRKLATLIPDVYACPSNADENADETKPSTTSYLAVLGPSTMWPGSEVRSLLVTDGQIKDGTSRTVMVVEVADSGIHWMEPRDLHVLQMAPTINPRQGQGISSPHESGAHALFGDGSVRFLPSDVPAETVRQLLLIDDGVPDEDW